MKLYTNYFEFLFNFIVFHLSLNVSKHFLDLFSIQRYYLLAEMHKQMLFIKFKTVFQNMFYLKNTLCFRFFYLFLKLKGTSVMKFCDIIAVVSTYTEVLSSQLWILEQFGAFFSFLQLSFLILHKICTIEIIFCVTLPFP